jgi:uncharacterized protein (DUF2147 family)
MKVQCAALLAVGLLAPFGALGAAARPDGPLGLWRVADGSAIIRIKACGPALCGYVYAAPAPRPGEKSVIGVKILNGMKRDGDVWRGPIYNLDDGKTYGGQISMKDDGHLKIRGCVPNGVCGGETWKREPSPR